MSRKLSEHNRKYSHPSVQALLAEYPQQSDPKKIIVNLAQEKRRVALKYGWEGPAYCPLTFCSLFGISCQEANHEIGSDGRIFPREGGKALIEYRGDRPEERIRFTIFHEFVHTLFPDFCTYGVRHHNLRSTLSDAEKQFERLCDKGAAELLLPTEDFLRDLDSSESFSFEELLALRARYGASIDACCIRAAELERELSYAFMFLSVNSEAPDVMTVRYSAKTSQFRAYIPNGLKVPVNSVAFKALGLQHGGCTQFVQETLWMGKSSRTFWVRAMRLDDVVGMPDYPRVLLQLSPKKEITRPLKSQPDLFY